MNAFVESQHPRVATGQFTEKQNSAPVDQLADEVLETPTRPNAASVLTAKAIQESQKALMNTAKQITRSFNIDETNAADIVQDSWVHLLERDGRHGDIAERVSEKAFLNLTARKYGNDYGNDARFGLRSEDFRARRELRAAAEAFRVENDRKMTPSEYEALAGEIRMGYKPGQRPKPDYWREISQLSLDVTVGANGDTTFGDTLEGHSDETTWDAQEDAAALALHRIEEKQATKDDIRKELWPIVSIRVAGAPQVIRESITAAQAKRHKVVAAEAGGASELAYAWRQGYTTPEQDAALFAPFGDIDNDQRERVIEVLDENPQFADRIWASGLAAAQR